MRVRRPAGAATSWDVSVVRLVPGDLVEWASDSTSSWLAEGMDRFLQSDLPALISRDVLRMKELIETGSAGL